ncbi:MAG: NADPH-dependent FMN reductase [Candidatus Izemoplasmataceae bacterium]
MSEPLRIGIILGSTREGRVSPQVGDWVKKKADQLGSADYEIVDIKDYNLPLLGTSDDTSGVERYNQKLAELDGFLFIVQEYNHSMSAALKNAMDSAKEVWFKKAAGIVSYGSGGGVRAAEHLRAVLSELRMTHVRTHPLLSLFDDFENFSNFKPRDIHDENLQALFEELEQLTEAMRTLRT